MPVGKLSLRGVPLWSILLSFVVGEIAFLPFPNWKSLVWVITSATAIMYAFPPVALAALRKRDPERPRPYRLPAPKVLAPTGFAAANIYRTGRHQLEVMIAIVVGFVLFLISRATTPEAERPGCPCVRRRG